MIIYKITPLEWLKRLGTQLTEPFKQNSGKVPKVVKLTNKKTLI